MHSDLCFFFFFNSLFRVSLAFCSWNKAIARSCEQQKAKNVQEQGRSQQKGANCHLESFSSIPGARYILHSSRVSVPLQLPVPPFGILLLLPLLVSYHNCSVWFVVIDTAWSFTSSFKSNTSSNSMPNSPRV